MKYIHQSNQGLSAARNTGIKYSNGAFLVFLDADDLLYPVNISLNLQHLINYPQAAFVSGAHDYISMDNKFLGDKQESVVKDHYKAFLLRNYIGMHATVMYSRWVFETFSFDTSLKACEDYDLYLRIARHHPVIHHTTKLAAYRQHGSNMSSNSFMMLEQVLLVLRRQREHLRSDEERRALKKGIIDAGYYYCFEMYKSFRQKKSLPSAAARKAMFKFGPSLFFKMFAFVILQRLVPRSSINGKNSRGYNLS